MKRLITIGLVLSLAILNPACICAEMSFFRKQRVVDESPFYQWVKDALESHGVKTKPDGTVRFWAFGSKMPRPPEPGKVYATFQSEVYLCGIQDPILIEKIEADVRKKIEGHLQHKAKLTFFADESRAKILKAADFP